MICVKGVGVPVTCNHMRMAPAVIAASAAVVKPLIPAGRIITVSTSQAQDRVGFGCITGLYCHFSDGSLDAFKLDHC